MELVIHQSTSGFGFSLMIFLFFNRSLWVLSCALPGFYDAGLLPLPYKPRRMLMLMELEQPTTLARLLCPLDLST